MTNAVRDEVRDEIRDGVRPGAWDDALLVARLVALEISAWHAACSRANAAADDRAFPGVRLIGAAGPMRDRWLASLRAALPPAVPLRRLPLHASEGRLLGGLDLAASLATGRRIAERGVLAEADGGVVVAASAERLSASVVASLACVLDTGAVHLERDGIAARHAARVALIALDEGAGDDAGGAVGAGGANTQGADSFAHALDDRLAFRVDLRGVEQRDGDGSCAGPASDAAVSISLGRHAVDDGLLEALCATAQACGVDSPRAMLATLAAARGIAALGGRETPDEDDVAKAAGLVIAPRATRIPAMPAATPAPPASAETPPLEDADDAGSRDDDLDAPQAGACTDPADPADPAGSDDRRPPEADRAGERTRPPDDAPQSERSDRRDESALRERLVAAVCATLPAGVLARLAIRRASGRSEPPRSAGGAGRMRKSSRGAPVGIRPANARLRQRLNVIETLRAAVPWQRIRLAAAHAQTQVQADAAAKRRVLVRPEDFRVTLRRQRTESTTIFVVDASGSSAHNRMAEAMGAVELLLADCYVRRDQVALIAFRGRAAELALPPTRSLVRARRLLAGMPGGGGTPLATALDAAVALAETIRRRGQAPTLVILADGHPNVARDGRPGRREAEADARRAAQVAATAGFAAMLVDTSPRPQPFLEEIASLMQARYLPLPHASARAVAGAIRHASDGNHGSHANYANHANHGNHVTHAAPDPGAEPRRSGAR